MDRAVCGLMLVIACLTPAAVLHHGFYHHIDRAPAIAVDDSLANLCFTLADRGRYGFLSDPLQPATRTDRSVQFFNYGPWYWWCGALVSWLFGNSLDALRALHLYGLFAVALLAGLTFRRSLPAAGALCGLALLSCYDRLHWPMVRPDIMVSVFAALSMLFLTRAFLTPSPWPWFGAAFAAGSAAVSHQIAWGLIPGCGLAWLIWGFTLRPPALAKRRALGLALAGGAGAALVYLAAIGFRVGELVDLWSKYPAFFGGVHAGRYFAVLGQHLSMAFHGLPGAATLAALGGTAALLSLLGAAWLPPSIRAPWVGLIAPPTVLGGCYLLTLGLYPNYHAGYSILIHTTSCWSASALLAALAELLHRRRPAWTPIARTAATAVVVALGLLFARALVGGTSRWTAQALGRVRIDSYVDRVLDDLPDFAPMWGGLVFGLESGTRNQLIQFYQGPEFFEHIDERGRLELAPDYIIAGFFERRAAALNILRDRRELLDRQYRVLSAVPYELVALVHAQPYGTARIHQRHGPGQARSAGRPWVAVHLGGGRQWAHQLEPLPGLSFELTDPLTFLLADETGAPLEKRGGPAQVSTRALDPGVYLIHAAIDLTRRGTVGLLAAADRPRVTVDVNHAMDPGFSSATYLDYETDVYLLHEQTTYGRLHVGQVDAAEDTRFHIVDVARVVALAPPKAPGPNLSPALSLWQVVSYPDPLLQPRLLTATDSGIRVAGNDTLAGYQLKSPRIAVPPGARLRLTQPLRRIRGQVGLGVLSGDERRWLMAPRLVDAPVDFDTEGGDGIILMIANATATADQALPTEFELLPGGKLELLNDPATRRGLYVDELLHRAGRSRGPAREP